MSEKKVGKRLLTWVLVLVMTLSLLPLNVLANEGGEAAHDVVQGYYNENDVWTKGTDNSVTLPEGVDSVSKTAVPTGNSNEYMVKLEVVMKETKETQTSYAQAATVLVIDTSGSMSYCLLPEHEHTDSCYISTGVQCNDTHLSIKKVYHHIIGDGICIYDESDETYYKATLGCGMTEHTHYKGCGGDNSRLDTAKDAAINFLESYRAGGTGRYVALVDFNTSATVADAGWQDVSTEAGYTAILNAINGLKADGGTNLDDGLQEANPLFEDPQVQGIGSKNIIALTDGKPTYYMATGWFGPSVEGNGKQCSKEVFEATANTAASIRTSGTTLYSICFGAANEEVEDPNTNTNISLFNYLNTYIAPGKTYSAGDFTGLKNAFDAISTTITSGLSSGKVHDSLPDGVTSSAIPNGTAGVNWDLKDFEKVEEKVGDTTTYTYTKRYTVTIDPTQIQVNDGDYYPLNGRTFLTVKDSNGQDVQIDFPIPAGKVTLPKYTYTLTYDANGGSGAPDNQEVKDTTETSNTFTVSDQEPTREGYKFLGWATSSSATEATIKAGDEVIVTKDVPNKTIYAVWQQNKYTYTLTYDANGGSGAPDKQEVKDTTETSNTFTVSNQEPTREGYKFLGWSYSNAEDAAVNVDETVTVTKDEPSKTIYAVWQQNKYTYTLTYDANGGSGAPDKQEVKDTTETSNTFTVSNQEPTREGYKFLGWSYSNAEDAAVNVDETVTVTKDEPSKTIYAVWQEIKYTVTFNSNGGSAVASQTVKYNEKATKPTAPTKSGYTFAGWYTEEQLTNTYDFGTLVTKDITLYAKWNTNYVPYYPPVPPTVKIEDDDALGLNTTDHFAYIVGYGNGEVRPQNNITRAEVATIFFRLLTDDVRDENLTKTNRYSDVAATSWYNTAVSTLSSMGIITGYPDGTFRPNAAITRAEFAAIAARFDNDGDKTAAKFSDIANHWAKDEISIAYNNGWINGYPDGTFGPQRDITRAETMTLVNRVLNRQPEAEDDLLPNMTVWTDNANPKAWYYLAVQEATNSHYYEFKTNSQYEKWTELRETRDWTLLEK